MTDSPFPILVERLRDLAADPAAVTDADLIARFVRDRDPVAFEALVWRHARLVMGVCRRTLRHHQDAEDAFQAVFLLLARKAHRIRRGAALPAWLYTTAVRIARRARRRRRPVSVAEVPEQPITDPPLEAAETWAVLDAEVRRLPPRLRAAFVLCGLEGRSHADAARDLGVPKGTIDSRMAAAKRRLRTALARRGLTLAPAALLTAAVPELAYSDGARRAAALGLVRSADVSPAVAGLVAPAGVGRWLTGLAAAVTLAAAGTLAVMSGTAGQVDPPKPPDKSADGPKATAERRLPVTTPLFKRTTIGLPKDEDIRWEENASKVAWFRKLYSQITEESQQAQRPLIPPAIPVVQDGRLVYVNDMGVVYLAVTADKTFDPPLKAGETLWVSESDGWMHYGVFWSGSSWMDGMLPPVGSGRTELLANQTLKCALAVGKDDVHRVDDVTIIPEPTGLTDDGLRVDRGTSKTWPNEYSTLLSRNVLRFINRETGKVAFRFNRSTTLASQAKPVGGGVYLSAPLPVDDLLVLVRERDKRLLINCFTRGQLSLNGRHGSGDERTVEAAVQAFRWSTELVTASTAVVADPHRRIHAIHLTRAGDLIVCPTHLGRVVAVEAKTGKVRWTHEYAPLDAKRFPTFAPEWVVVPPAVVGDRYVYAPADFPELLCLNVADGKKVWGVKKGGGLYPAVVGDQVLVVGEKTIRSLNLKDGSEQWKADLPGLPCGRGAVLGDTYLVPISEPKTWKGLIAVVDLKAGKVAEVLRPEKDEPIGNLVVHGDFLISQTLTEIAVFPIKKRE